MPAPPLRTQRGVPSTASVGRIGTLSLEYTRQNGRTVFGRTSCQTPWHLLPPIYLDDTGSAYTLLVNPSGGLVGGDQLSIDLSVGPNAHVLISSPSANRVYRTLAEPSVQEILVHVGAEAILEWAPEHTIPFAGSRFRQTIDVTLSAGATVLLWDAVASGRIARGERWAFASLDNDIRIRTSSGAAVREHIALDLTGIGQGVGWAAEWDYVASLFIVGEDVERSKWEQLEAALAEILAQHHGPVMGGVSQPAVPGLVVKLVAKSAPAMTDVMHALWGSARRVLWNLPPAALRKY